MTTSLVVLLLLAIGIGFLIMWIFSIGLGITEVETLFATATMIGIGVLAIGLTALMICIGFMTMRYPIGRWKYWCDYESIEQEAQIRKSPGEKNSGQQNDDRRAIC